MLFTAAIGLVEGPSLETIIIVIVVTAVVVSAAVDNAGWAA
jgi:hypothetical protein